MHFWKLFLFALISSLITPATHAQDPAAVNPPSLKVEFENIASESFASHYEPIRNCPTQHPPK